MRRTIIAATALGAALAGGGLAVGTAWADDQPTLRIVTEVEPSRATGDEIRIGDAAGTTGGLDCPEKDGASGTETPSTGATDTL